jgi:hypothetical protein
VRMGKEVIASSASGFSGFRNQARWNVTISFRIIYGHSLFQEGNLKIICKNNFLSFLFFKAQNPTNGYILYFFSLKIWESTNFILNHSSNLSFFLLSNIFHNFNSVIGSQYHRWDISSDHPSGPGKCWQPMCLEQPVLCWNFH